MQDAFNLAWKLAKVLKEGAPETLLATYGEERLPVAREVLRTTERNTSLLFANTRLGRFLRDHVVFPLLNLPAIQARMVAKLSQLDQRYRDASLSWDRLPRLPMARLRAGDRAPDVVFGGAPGTSVFALLARSRFVAVTTGAAPPALRRALERLGIDVREIDSAADGVPIDLVDGTGDFRRLYGAREGELWLVRPDGYVGLCCASGRLDLARAYARRLFAPAAVRDAFGAAGMSELE